jgi:hypothetical protein
MSKKPNKMQECFKILIYLVLYEAQHVSGDTPSNISTLKLHWQPLVLHTSKFVGRAVVGRRQVAYEPTINYEESLDKIVCILVNDNQNSEGSGLLHSFLERT